MALDNTTGELFIGTSAGLCSYMTDSSQPSDKMTKDNVYAYPNPVSPDYHGLITVVGLTLNADVKIVTANGALVAEGRSNGGTFTWDGCDKQERRLHGADGNGRRRQRHGVQDCGRELILKRAYSSSRFIVAHRGSSRFSTAHRSSS